MATKDSFFIIYMNYYPDSYLDKLPSEPLWALEHLVEHITIECGFEDASSPEEPTPLDFLIESISILRALVSQVPNVHIESEIIIEGYGYWVLYKHLAHRCAIVTSAITKPLFEYKQTMYTEKLDNRYGAVVVYSFSPENIDKIQNLINELRREITTSNIFDDKHRQRMLKRLEKMQRELHQKLTTLDTFWGAVGDAGVALNHFGKDTEPFVKRLKELTELIAHTQKRGQELPNDSLSSEYLLR